MATMYKVSSRGSSGTASSELNLIRASQSSDRDTFAGLYETHLDRIRRYIYFRVYDRELSEDLTSLVFLKVWEHLDSFEGGRIPFAKWIYRIAHNTVIDYYRTRKQVDPLEDVDPLKLSHSDNVDEILDLDTRSQELAAALDELTGLQREVLILRFLWGLTSIEIADKLKKGRGAIRALQMRGLRKLAQHPAIRKGFYTSGEQF
jgi:RNA polymerase sigma-70 factor (ECF subfamily)